MSKCCHKDHIRRDDWLNICEYCEITEIGNWEMFEMEHKHDDLPCPAKPKEEQNGI